MEKCFRSAGILPNLYDSSNSSKSSEFGKLFLGILKTTRSQMSIGWVDAAIGQKYS